MSFPRRAALAAALITGASSLLFAQPGVSDAPASEFLEEEFRIVTAARRPAPLRHAPATTYVITSEDIKLSGAITIWDLLRRVPGVDVSGVRAMQGGVSIRGLNKSGNNRTLILLDGKTVLNGYFDSMIWETIPVTLLMIDRIEVVEGPASALYGSNALNGVINIITKTPQQIDGGRARYSAGSRQTHIGSMLYGRKAGPWGYRVSGGWRSADRFDEPGRAALNAGQASGLLEWTGGEDRRASVSGGLVQHGIQSGAAPGRSFDVGQTGYLRLDGMVGLSRGRFFWNAGRSTLRDLPALNNPDLLYDTFDVTLDRGVELPFDHTLTLETNWRRNQARSKIFETGPVAQDLFSGAFEDEWRPREEFSLLTGARLDRHPLAGWSLSPRGSAQWFVSPDHTLRFSAGLAFRNPTLVENYIQTTVPGAVVDTRIVEAPGLRPERMRTFELAYRGAFERVRLSAAVFHYTLTHIIAGSPPVTLSAGPPALVQISAANRGATRAVGYEAGGEADILGGLTSFANYSYQSLKDEQGFQLTAVSAPKHKGNVGARCKRGPWMAELWGHAVDQTLWPNGTGPAARVPAYAMLNGSVLYRFAGAWQGLEASVSGMNLTDHGHHEMAPFRSAASPGQGAEFMRSRWLGTVSYRF